MAMQLVEFEQRADGSEAPVGRVTRTAARSDSGRWLDRHLLTIVAAVAAAPALRQPTIWFLGCATVSLALLSVDSVRGQATNKGTADVVVVPARVAGRLVLGAVNPVNWLKALAGAAVALTIGALAAALAAAARWLTAHGTDGILTAMRMGAWAHTPAWATTVGCFLLLRGVGSTRDRRATAVRSVFSPLPETVVAGAIFCVVVAGASLALAGPRVDVATFHGSDGLAFVPVGLRTTVDGLRDDVVADELDALTGCLDGRQKGLWTARYSAGNPLGDADVATLTADPARPPRQSSLAAAALAATNQLAPWVEVVEVNVGEQVMLVVDRRGLAHDEPLTDAALLRSHAVGAPEWLRVVAPSVDAHAVLTCSAQTPL